MNIIQVSGEKFTNVVRMGQKSIILNTDGLGKSGVLKRNNPMAKPLSPTFADLLDRPELSDLEIRRLVGWHALSLVDLLQRKCITIRYAERALFNLDVIEQLERRSLADCVELIDWGMQLEDWDEHTPEQLSEELIKIAELAQQLLATDHTSPSFSSRSARQ